MITDKIKYLYFFILIICDIIEKIHDNPPPTPPMKISTKKKHKYAPVADTQPVNSLNVIRAFFFIDP